MPHDCYIQHYKAIVTATLPEPIKGITTLLQYAKKHHIPVAVVSNKEHELVLHEIEVLGWNRYIDIAMGTDAMTKAKLDSDMLSKALDQLNIKETENIIIIGDTSTDMLAAQKLNVKAVLLNNEKNTDHDIFCDIRMNGYHQLIEHFRHSEAQEKRSI